MPPFIVGGYDICMSTPDRDRLFRTAARQAGHFTVAQAQECGFDRAQLRGPEKAGTFARVYPGVYRLVRYPSPSYGEVMAAWLAAGADEAVVSHETALRLHGLSRRPGREIHLTIARGAERSGEAVLRSVKLHRARRRWRPEEVVRWEGMALTAPARTIADAAETGLAAEEILAAIRAALEGGLATRKELTSALRGRSEKVMNLLRRGIRQMSTGKASRES
ncbi:MAG: hypothetical protein HY334_08785 [Armatimonadetes bacterium]|nr:hypothetical protein [Armatimonadota bacterium]